MVIKMLRKSPLLFVMIIVLFIRTFISLQTAAAMNNEPDDFRGMRWSIGISELSGMRLIAAEGDMKFYEKLNDNLTIGNAKASKIVYGFYKDSFYSLFIYYDGLINFSKLKDIYVEKYGEAYHPNEYINRFSWSGTNLDILLTFDDILKNGRIVYFYRPIMDRIEHDEKENAQKGAADL
jgi:hypothetical protein